MLRARAVGALVLPSGFVAGHLVGCVVAHGPSHDHSVALTMSEHSASHSVGQLALPLLILSVVVAGLMGARGTGLRVSGRSLALAMSTSYFALEMFEHLGHGMDPGSVLADPVLQAGLAAQVLLAFGFARLLRGAYEVGSRFRPASVVAVRLGRVRPWQPHDERLVPAVFMYSFTVRGPPGMALARV